MHIVFATMQYGADYHQGTERYIENLSSGLINGGHRVTILTGDPEDKHTTVEAASYISNGTPEIIKLSCSGWATLLGAELNKQVKLLASLKPDVFHMVNPGHIGVNLINAAHTIGIKTVITVTDFWWLCPKHTLTKDDNTLCKGFENRKTCLNCIAKSHRSSPVRLLANRPATLPIATRVLRMRSIPHNIWKEWKDRRQHIDCAVRKASKVICLSETGYKFISDYFPDAKPHYIPTGLSEEWFNSPKHNIPNNKTGTKIGYAGAISSHKGIHILTEALAQLNSSSTELHLAGPIQDQAYWKKLQAKQLKLIKYSYHGLLPHTKLRGFIDKMDLMIIPSTWPENQPQIILECLARNTPVICSDAPGAAELISKEYVYQTNNSKSLTTKITNWLNSRDYRQKTKATNISETIKHTEQVYNSII